MTTLNSNIVRPINFEGHTDFTELCNATPHMDEKWYNDGGVFTIEDFVRSNYAGMISDQHKANHGFRLRLDWTELSLEELMEIHKEEVGYQAREAKWQKEAEMRILQTYLDAGAPNIETARRWQKAA
tara:strand:- start:102 stop:482 length:381 start_codon:yes stop_codon:yes gene_type:complete